MEIDRNQAQQIALQVLKAADSNREYIITTIEDFEFGWVVYYDTKLSIENNDKSYSVPGATPLMIGKSGNIKFLPSAVPFVEAIQKFGKTINE